MKGLLHYYYITITFKSYQIKVLIYGTPSASQPSQKTPSRHPVIICLLVIHHKESEVSSYKQPSDGIRKDYIKLPPLLSVSFKPQNASLIFDENNKNVLSLRENERPH